MNEPKTQEKPSEQAVAVFNPTRLPWHPAIAERFGVDKAAWPALVDAVFPAAKSVDSVILALSYCKARKLDPFKRPVHIVPIWDKSRGGFVDTVWPSIAELRTTAFRTGQYAGKDETEFGDTKTQKFKGRVKCKDGWEERTVEATFPEWCRVTVYRELNGRVCKFVGPKVYWTETVGTIGASDIPNDMWIKRASGQLEKCGEAAALRTAFPEELGNSYTAEEMEGRTMDTLPGRPIEDAEPTPARPTRDDFKGKAAESPSETQQQESTAGAESTVVEATVEGDEPTDYQAVLEEMLDHLQVAQRPADIEEVVEAAAPRLEGMPAAMVDKWEKALDTARTRVAAQGPKKK